MLIASIQMSGDKTETRDMRIGRAEKYLQELCDAPVRPQQVIFPELWATGVSEFASYIPEAEPEQGFMYDMMSAWAKKLGSYIHTGTFIEKDGGNYYNTALLIDPNGKIAGKYRKIHPFGFKEGEAAVVTPGSQISVAQTEYGKVGFGVCYDLRFPELFRAMLNLGAEYFLVSAGWPLARLDHWKLLNQTRAVENQCFVIACNGVHDTGPVLLGGHSMVIDPWGEVLAESGTDECIVTCEIDPAKVGEIRKRFPVLRDKKLI